MVLDGTMFYTHLEAENEYYLIYSDGIIEYDGRDLLVIEREHKLREEISTLVPGFLELTMKSDDGEKISEVTQVKSDDWKDVAGFLRSNNFATGDIYFLNEEF